MIDKSEFEFSVLKPLERWMHLGEMTNELRTRYIGHRPDLAPMCYLHEIHAPLPSEGILRLESKFQKPLPEQYRAFLSYANGMNLFMGDFYVLGQTWDERQYPDYFYPSQLLHTNEIYADDIKHNELIVACNAFGGLIVCNFKTGEIEERDPDFEPQSWADFDSWLVNSIAEASMEHDENGDLLDLSKSTYFH